MAIIGVVVTAITLGSFVPRFAINVSQKHILDTWREVERGPTPEQRMFKLPFAGGGRRDTNFYTAAIPRSAIARRRSRCCSACRTRS